MTGLELLQTLSDPYRGIVIDEAQAQDQSSVVHVFDQDGSLISASNVKCLDQHFNSLADALSACVCFTNPRVGFGFLNQLHQAIITDGLENPTPYPTV